MSYCRHRIKQTDFWHVLPSLAAENSCASGHLKNNGATSRKNKTLTCHSYLVCLDTNTHLFILLQGILKGEHCTANLLFDWFGVVCFANKNKIC